MAARQITRRQFSAALLGASAALAAGRGISQATQLRPPSVAPLNLPPNIIVILADDLGYRDLGCYGSIINHTPNLDMLAAQGATFTDFHGSNPICTPSRASLLTGHYPQRYDLENVFNPATADLCRGLTPFAYTFADLAKSVGYRTALCGKWHLGYMDKFNPLHFGFDSFHGFISGAIDYYSHIGELGADWWDGTSQVEERGYSTDLITQHALRFIEQESAAPFCLYIAYQAPHFPYQSRDRIWDRGRMIPEIYRAMLEAMDQGIGHIIATLERRGILQDTLIFFASDNGARIGFGENWPWRGTKGTLYEGGHRVPAIASWPGQIAPGTIVNETTTLMDIWPTLAAAMAAPIPTGLTPDGANLLPLLLDGSPLPERTHFWRHNGFWSARRGPWKLLTDRLDQTALWNLESDPREQTDLAATEPDRVNYLRDELVRWEEVVLACECPPRTQQEVCPRRDRASIPIETLEPVAPGGTQLFMPYVSGKH